MFVQQEISKKGIALVNDIVTLKIVSHLNGTIHAINEPELGVLFTNAENVERSCTDARCCKMYRMFMD